MALKMFLKRKNAYVSPFVGIIDYFFLIQSSDLMFFKN